MFEINSNIINLLRAGLLLTASVLLWPDFKRTRILKEISEFVKSNPATVLFSFIAAFLLYRVYRDSLANTGSTAITLFLFYRIIAFALVILVIGHHTYRLYFDKILDFLAQIQEMLVTLVLAGLVVFAIIHFFATSDFSTTDIVVFIMPYYKVLIPFSIIIFLGLVFIDRRKDNFLLLNYAILGIYMLSFIFVIWIIIGAFGTFKISDQFVQIYLQKSPGNIHLYRFIVISIFLFFAISLMLFLVIIGSRITKIATDILSKYYRDYYQNLIIEFIYSDDDPEEEQRIITKINKGGRFFSSRRNVLMDELLHLHKYLTGDIVHKSETLYSRLKLYRDSYYKLHRGGWPTKVAGIHELSYFRYAPAFNILRPFTNSRNSLVRIEAELGLINIDPSPDILVFFKFYDHRLTDYDQIRIIHALERNRNINVNIGELLKSSNNTVIAFGLKIVGVFGQTQNYKQIIHFIDHPDMDVRTAAIFALGKVGVVIDPDIIRLRYESEIYQNQLSYLKMVGRYPNPELEDWLKHILKFNNDHHIRLNTLKALHELDNSIVSNLEKEDYDDYDLLVPLINHVTDKRIENGYIG